MTCRGSSLLVLALCLLLAGCGGVGGSEADEPVVTPKAGKATKCRPGSTYEYVETVVCHLKLAASHNRRIENNCGNYLDDACKTAITNYRAQLESARTHLGQVKVLPFLRKADRKLRRAIRHDIRAADMALKAINDIDQSGFLRAWGVHGQAGIALNRASHAAGQAWERLWR